MEGVDLDKMVCMECGVRVEQVAGGWEHVPLAGDGMGRHDPQPVTLGTYNVNRVMRDIFH